MGYQATIVFEDSQKREWVGQHRPQIVDLRTVFRYVAELDATSLLATPEAAPDIWQQALPRGADLIRMLSPSAVHLQTPSTDGVCDLVLKLCQPPSRGLFTQLKSLAMPSRAKRAHLTAHRLRAIGISTPRPLGYLERRRLPYQAASFVVYEFVRALSLVELRERLWSGVGFTVKRTLLARTARLIRSLHLSGVFHADLHAGNILLNDEETMVVDLESVRGVARRERIILKTLERLEREFAEGHFLTRSDRMRFLHIYLLHEADARARRRALWRRVGQLAASKRNGNEAAGIATTSPGTHR